MYRGYRSAQGDSGAARVGSRLGNDPVLIATVRAALAAAVLGDPATVESEGRVSAATSFGSAQLVAGVWADWLLQDGHTPTLPLPLALRILHRSTGMDEDADLRSLALDRLHDDPNAEAALTAFWRAAIASGADYLPLANVLDSKVASVHSAAIGILRGRQSLRTEILRSVAELAAPGLTAAEFLKIAERVLGRRRKTPAYRLWTLLAFLADPAKHAWRLVSDLDDAEGQTLLGRYWDGNYGEVQALGNDKTVARCDALIRHLGPKVGPSNRTEDDIDRLSELVAGALASLAREPTAESVATLQGLRECPALSAWTDLIAHHQAQQANAIRAARFEPPQPRAVAEALVAGPPASPADLRAVVNHVIEELARDIRESGTASWRLFWNTPHRGKKTPRVENDCRDLIADRLRDRLDRYGIPVNSTSTETRSMNNMRADLMVLGAVESAVPVEAKRHWNPEIWTAALQQLIPYGLSSRSSGHGILLIFWFGTEQRKVPAPPDGGPAPQTPGGLRLALLERVPPDQQGKINVVVVDVSRKIPTTT